MRHYKIVTISSALIFACFALRIFQLITTIDPATGFGLPSFFGINLTIYIITALAAVGVFVLTLLSRRAPVHAPVGLSIPLSIASFAVCAANLLDALRLAPSINSFWAVVFVFFLATSAVSFLLYGISKVSSFEYPEYMSLFPLGLLLFRLIETFISYTGIPNISECVYDILSLTLCLKFFSLHSKLILGNAVRDSSIKILSIGMLSLLTGAVSVLPKFTVFIINSSVYCGLLNDIYLTDLVIYVYIVFFLVRLYSASEIGRRRSVSYFSKK